MDLIMLYTLLVVFFIDTTNEQSVRSHLINSLNYCLLLFVEELLAIFEAFV